MKANRCPVCGQGVMTYRRFIREAEPTKICTCGSCGAKVRRSPRALLFLLLMCVLLAAAGLFLFIPQVQAGTHQAIIISSAVILFMVWLMLTNFLGWMLVGWRAVEKEE